MPKRNEAVALDIDDLTEEQIQERLQQTLESIHEFKRLWHGMVRLPEKERKTSVGRILAVLGGPLKLLFSLLLTRDGKETPLGALFNVLGDQDRGEDPNRFEPALLLRRMARVEAQAKVVEELEDFVRLMSDDVLHTSEMVVAPGLLALDLARSIAKGNTEHRSALAPVLDSLGNLTKKARQRKTEQRASATEPVKTP